jgi:aminopeptidase YwaD
MRSMHELCDVIGHRPTGSSGELKARDYLVAEFKRYGLIHVTAEPFNTPIWRRGPCVARITSPITRDIRVLALPLNRSHAVNAEAVWLDFETEAEFARIQHQVEGKIVINQGEPKVGLSGTTLHRSERVRLAHGAGAAAFMWVSNWPGHVLPTGSMDADIAREMPAFGITREDALLVKRLNEYHGMPVTLTVETENELTSGTSWNVVAELPGRSPDAPIVMATAHYDSHDVTEGAFDNAAGCAAVLECARVLSEEGRSDGCRVRFVIFSAEEIGLRGSTEYTKLHREDLASIRFLFNADGLGVTPSSKYVHVPFNRDLVKYIDAAYLSLGFSVEVENALAMNWDHAPFAARGVPVASLTAKWPAGQLLHFGHTPSDSLDKIDPDDMRLVALCFTALVHRAAYDHDWSIAHLSREAVMRELASAGKTHLLERFEGPLDVTQ